MSEINSRLANERCVRLQAGNPEQLLDIALEVFAACVHTEQLLAVDFNFLEYWRDEQPTVALTALYYLQHVDNNALVTAAVIQSSVLTTARWQRLQDKTQSIPKWMTDLPTPWFRLDQAILLQPISIPKPWGREIWYTGIERRGVAEVSNVRFAVALPWLLAIARQRLLGGNKEPILLKILDPLPEAVFGDLYFEMHEQKQEVYVVTAIDERAWPDGIGAIRFGFNAELRARYGDDKKFLDDYLTAVRDYRDVRKIVDQQLDAKREAEKIDLDQPLSASVLKAWLAELLSTLNQQEQTLRAAMERFTGLLPLRIGDVVKVPCLLPHSLQHGVRTVEFQTPVYERLILSFAQKVLTQSEWDTDAAATRLCMDPPAVAPWRICAQGDGWLEEQIVEFDDFEVRRVTMQPGAGRHLDTTAQYALLIAVGDGLQLAKAPLAADTAVLLPAEWTGGDVINRGAKPAYLLLAIPVALRG